MNVLVKYRYLWLLVAAVFVALYVCVIKYRPVYCLQAAGSYFFCGYAEIRLTPWNVLPLIILLASIAFILLKTRCRDDAH